MEKTLTLDLAAQYPFADLFTKTPPAAPAAAQPIDCAALAKMPLNSLLYYALFGDGIPSSS